MAVDLMVLQKKVNKVRDFVQFEYYLYSFPREGEHYFCLEFIISLFCVSMLL